MEASERYQLQRQINNAVGRINELNAEKRAYQNLKSRISGQILPNLRNAKNAINDARVNLKNSYSSTEVNSKISSLQSCESRVNSMISTLNGSVIPEISNRISVINQEKASKERIRQNALYRLRRG